MPELPEVETTCRGIAPALINQTISRVIVRQTKLRYPVPPNLSQLISKQRILAITRRAKYIIIQLDAGFLLIHLGMSGHLRLVSPTQSAEKHAHIDIVINPSVCLRYTDPRRFGLVLYSTGQPLAHPLLIQQGPEPLSRAFNQRAFYALCQKRKTAIKALIMDNKVVVGVGNIYAQESLFLAKLSPLRPANSLSKAQAQLLVKHIKSVLKKSIQQGGTSLKDFYQVSGKPGYFKQSLNVYGLAKTPCQRCKTTLQEVVIAQRNTVFCPNCQR